MNADIQAGSQSSVQQKTHDLPAAENRLSWLERMKNWLQAIPANVFALGLVLYLVLFLIFWGYVVMDVASQEFRMLGRFSTIAATSRSSEPLTMILLALSGGAIGGIVYSLDKLIKYGTKPDTSFDLRHTGDYLVRHMIAAALGAVVFALVLGGFIDVNSFTASAGGNQSSIDPGSGYFAFALGFITGFGSYQVTRKLDQVIKVIFGRFTEDDLK